MTVQLPQILLQSNIYHARIQRGGGQGLLHKNIGSLSNIGTDPLEKKHKATKKPARIQCWAIIGTPAKRHLNGVSLAGRRRSAYSGALILSPLIDSKKNVVKVGPPLTKLSGSALAYFFTVYQILLTHQETFL